MPNKRVIILLVFLILVALIILLLQFFYGSKNNNEKLLPSPSTQFNILTQPIASGTEASVTEMIKIKFSKPVDPASLELELIPVNEIKIYFDSTNTELTIEPTNAWAFSTEYFIKIPKSTKSMDGSNLEGDYTYGFKTYPYSGI